MDTVSCGKLNVYNLLVFAQLTEIGKNENVSTLRILIWNTKFPVFMGFVETGKYNFFKYAINRTQNTKF